MRFRYSIDFRCGIAVFADFFGGIAVLVTPQCPPPSQHVTPSPSNILADCISSRKPQAAQAKVESCA